MLNQLRKSKRKLIVFVQMHFVVEEVNKEMQYSFSLSWTWKIVECPFNENRKKRLKCLLKDYESSLNTDKYGPRQKSD